MSNQKIRQGAVQDVNINGGPGDDIIIVNQHLQQNALQINDVDLIAHPIPECKKKKCKKYCGDLEIKPYSSIGVTGQLGCPVCICPYNDTSACSRSGCLTNDCQVKCHKDHDDYDHHKKDHDDYDHHKKKHHKKDDHKKKKHYDDKGYYSSDDDSHHYDGGHGCKSCGHHGGHGHHGGCKSCGH